MGMRREVRAILWSVAAASAVSAAAGTGGCGPRAESADKQAESRRGEFLRQAAEALAPLHEKKKPPKSNDWMARHKEDPQSFDDYVESGPNHPTAELTTFYILPMGEFGAAGRKLLDDTAAMMTVFFGVPVKMLEPMGLDAVPAKHRRGDRGFGRQLSTTWVFDTLRAKRPKDAVGLIALTTADLWPGEAGWNFVFGEASTVDRIGAWSLARFGDPDKNYGLVLRRTLQTATHEAAHMLGMWHCISWECGMNGSNHLDEADRTPMPFCAECERKLWWACGTDPADRFKKLAEYAESRKLKAEAVFWKRSFEAVKDLRPPAPTP